MKSITIQIAESDQEIESCSAVMRELRETLDPDTFLERVRAQEKTGYHLAYVLHDGNVVAVAGFRFLETLAQGRHLFVDDLVTRSTDRSRGHGRALFLWLCEHARQKDCESLALDSGRARKDAHRFYEREGMEYRSLRFHKEL